MQRTYMKSRTRGAFRSVVWTFMGHTGRNEMYVSYAPIRLDPRNKEADEKYRRSGTSGHREVNKNSITPHVLAQISAEIWMEK